MSPRKVFTKEELLRSKPENLEPAAPAAGSSKKKKLTKVCEVVQAHEVERNLWPRHKPLVCEFFRAFQRPNPRVRPRHPRTSVFSVVSSPPARRPPAGGAAQGPRQVAEQGPFQSRIPKHNTSFHSPALAPLPVPATAPARAPRLQLVIRRVFPLPPTQRSTGSGG
jgi:hypothetical protein